MPGPGEVYYDIVGGGPAAELAKAWQGRHNVIETFGLKRPLPAKARFELGDGRHCWNYELLVTGLRWLEVDQPTCWVEVVLFGRPWEGTYDIDTRNGALTNELGRRAIEDFCTETPALVLGSLNKAGIRSGGDLSRLGEKGAFDIILAGFKTSGEDDSLSQALKYFELVRLALWRAGGVFRGGRQAEYQLRGLL